MRTTSKTSGLPFCYLFCLIQTSNIKKDIQHFLPFDLIHSELKWGILKRMRTVCTNKAKNNKIREKFYKSVQCNVTGLIYHELNWKNVPILVSSYVWCKTKRQKIWSLVLWIMVVLKLKAVRQIMGGEKQIKSSNWIASRLSLIMGILAFPIFPPGHQDAAFTELDDN